MTRKQILDVFEILDSASADGDAVADLLRSNGVNDVVVTSAHGVEDIPVL